MAWKHLLTQAGSAPSRILPAIIASQFAGTSLWFAGNAVLPDLQRDLALRPDALGNITAAVQFGFIAGTLIFALLAISDRYSPRGIFLWCSVLGAAANAGTAFAGSDVWYLAAARFATGFFIAGIYPVGMKIASGWYQRELGRALGFLVGALVLGTAFPHFVRGMGEGMPWGAVLLAVSVLSCMGGVLMFLLVWGVAIVGDSPQFSALNARYAPLQLVGSALTLANCIGFGITIFSIQLLNHALSALPIQYVFLLLAPGPIFGLLSMRSLLRSK
jgi:MFS family permease